MSLELVDICKTFRSRDLSHMVFKNLNLFIPKGVNMGVIGPNGSGKSTLLNIVAGSLQPDAGHVIRRMSVSWPIGYAGVVNPNLSGFLNCKFIARMYGRKSEDVIKFVGDFSELEEYMAWPVKTYSSGMRSRFNFAMSIAIDFDCILVDEAMSAGDEYFRAKAEAVMDDRRRRSSLLYVSHNLGEIMRLCDRVLVLGGPEPELSDNVKERVLQYKEEIMESRKAAAEKRGLQIRERPAKKERAEPAPAESTDG